MKKIKFRDFLTIWWKAPFLAGEKSKKKRSKFRGSSSRTCRSRICSCVHHGPAWSCNMYVCVGTVYRALGPKSTCCGPSILVITYRRVSHVKIKGVYTSKKTPQYSGVLRYTIAEYEGVNRLFHIWYVINTPGYRLSINIPRTRCVHVRVHG